MEGFDISKFKWQEMFLDHDGKTSATALIGFIACLVCVCLFTMLVCFYLFKVVEAAMILQFIDKLIIWFGIGSGLLGVKSLSSKVTGGGLEMLAKKTRCKKKQAADEDDEPEERTKK